MKQTNIYLTICICLFAEFSIRAGESKQFYFADSLFKNKLYSIAAIEFERAFFYAEDVEEKNYSLLKKAECLKQLEKFELAEKCLMRINYFGISDTMVYTARHQTALCAYLSEHFTNAESQLLQMQLSVKDTNLTSASLPLFALVLNELQKWDEAKNVLLKYIKNSSIKQTTKDSLKRETENLYQTKNYPKLKKANKAKVLASIIPGMGQVYAGYFWEGAANGSFQAIALLATAYGIYTGYYVTSAVVSFGLFQKFYAGAIVRTDFLVQKKNYKLLRNYNDKLKEKIIVLKR